MCLGAWLYELYQNACFTPNWGIAVHSCEKTKGDEMHILRWPVVCAWDQVSSVGAQRAQWLKRRKASWAIQRLVLVSQECFVP